MTSKALGALMLSGLFFVGPAVAQQGSPPPGGSPSSPAQPGTPGAPSSGTPTDTPKGSCTPGEAVEGKDSQEVFSQTMCARHHVHIRGPVQPSL